jgi:hypothetical protein
MRDLAHDEQKAHGLCQSGGTSGSGSRRTFRVTTFRDSSMFWTGFNANTARYSEPRCCSRMFLSSSSLRLCHDMKQTICIDPDNPSLHTVF